MATPEETRQATNAAKLAEKGQEALTKAKEAYIKAEQEANEVKAKGNTLLEKEIALNEEIAKQKKALRKSTSDEIALIKNLNIQKQRGESDGVKQAENLLELHRNKDRLLKLEAEQLKENLGIVKEATKFQKKYGKDVNKNLDEANKKTNTLSNALAKFASKLPVVGPSLKKAFGMGDNIATLGADISSVGGMIDGKFGKALQKGGGGITKFAGKISASAMIVFAFVAKLAKLGLEFDNLSKSIGRATGFGNDFANTLHEGYKQTMSAGVSMGEYASSVTSLANSFSGFNPSAEKTNIHLANTSSQLTKLGVSADSSSKLMDHFHRAMGLSQKAAADMTAQLVLMGKQVGITASKMASDFQASAGRLAIYGKNNIKVFKQLAAQAKATGLEMSTLLGISAKFDTFEGAADSAANLNAVLGTQLSTLELMNASDAERIKMMKEQVQASVGNFDSLDKFTKMHIAQAMGLKDVGEAQRLLNMSQAEAAKYAQGQQESADIQAELAERTKDLVPLMDKLKIAFMKFVMAFSPIIKGFTWLVEKLAVVADGVGWFLETFGPALVVIGAITKAVFAFGAAAGTIATPIGWLVVAIGALYVVFNQLWDIFHKPGSLSLAAGLMDKTIGNSMKSLGADAQAAAGDIDGLSGKMDGLHDTTHKGPGNSFDIQAMASLDTTAIAAGFNKIKSAVMELSNIKIDGFLAMSTTGDSSSFVMGSDGLIKSISEGKLIVDVKMPEMKLPEVLVKVFIGDRELKSIIKTEVQAQVGAMG